MFYIHNSYSIKNIYFKLENNYILKYQYIYGFQGNLTFSLIKNETFYPSRNFKGKPLAFPVGPEAENITCGSKKNNFVYFIQLIYSMRNQGAEEVKSGETISNFIDKGHFPLFYYLKIKNDTYINIDINLRLNSYNDTLLHNNFEIKGYVLDEDFIRRKINGEYIQLDDAIDGYYSDNFKIGLLQVNREIVNNKNYILIEINNKDQGYINSILLVEIVTKEYNDNPYFIPINQYILETFDGENNETRKENKYYLSSRDKGSEDYALIEISPSYPDIVIQFEPSANYKGDFKSLNGFNKYYSRDAKNDDVYFSVINPKGRKGVNYMMRYYFTGIGDGIKYTLDLNPKREIIDLNNGNVTVNLTFNGIHLKYYDIDLLQNINIYFYIYGYLFKSVNNSDELLNTTCKLTERIPSFEDHTRHDYNYYHLKQWSLVFNNIPKTENFIYDLQIKANSIIESNIFNEEFLIFNTKINLTDIKPEEKNDYTWTIILISVGVVIIIIVVIFTIIYIRLRKRNRNLQEDLVSMAYSNDVQKNVLTKELENAQRDRDYESTFI